jgi:outer membrane protein
MRFSGTAMAASLAGLVVGFSNPASAQQAGGLVLELPQIENYVSLGLGALPDYEGSDDYTFGIGPAGLLKPWDNNRYFRLVATELSFNILNHRTWNLGPVVNYRFARDDVDDPVVDSLEEVDAALEVGAFASWSWISDFDPRHRFVASLQAMQDVMGGHEGFLGTASVRYFVPVARPITLSAGAAVTYASGDYMETYFGISQADSAQSGLPMFDANGGVRDVRFPVMAIFSLSPSWHIGAGAMFKLLLDDAADSPIVDERGSDFQVLGGIAVAYAW